MSMATEISTIQENAKTYACKNKRCGATISLFRCDPLPQGWRTIPAKRRKFTTPGNMTVAAGKVTYLCPDCAS